MPPRHHEDPLPALAHVLRLARRVTGREYAGVALHGLAAVPELDPSAVSLPVDLPVVRRTLAADGVYQESDTSELPDGPIRSYAGIGLGGSGAASLGVLWVGGSAPGLLDDGPCEDLRALAALLEAELERSGAMGLAAQVQRQLLPERAPDAPGYDMAAECRPALEVGGDFYDWWRTDDTLRVVVADVMGKGMPAAIVAAAVRAMLRAALTFRDPAAALGRVAGDLQADLDQVARFATCFAARVHLPTGRVEFADAGHGLATVLRRDGTVTQLASEDLPLGAVPGWTWTVDETILAPGDTLLVVSDGVLDLFESPEAGIRRAADLHRRGATAADLVEALRLIQLHDEPTDDLTVVAVRRQA